LINPNELRQFYEDNFRERSKLEPESALRSAARATTVVGKILDSLSKGTRVNKGSLWIIRLGQVFWSLVEVAVPRSFPDLLFRHWLKLVYFLELLLFAGSTVLIAESVQRFALVAFAITVSVHMAVLLLRDLILSRNKWINLLKTLGGLVLVALIIAGGLAFGAVLGLEFAWNIIWTVRSWFLIEDDIGLNTKTLAKGFWIVVLLLFFLWAIRNDVKALFKPDPKL
jgi:hypothetical protein